MFSENKNGSNVIIKNKLRFRKTILKNELSIWEEVWSPIRFRLNDMFEAPMTVDCYSSLALAFIKKGPIRDGFYSSLWSDFQSLLIVGDENESCKAATRLVVGRFHRTQITKMGLVFENISNIYKFNNEISSINCGLTVSTWPLNLYPFDWMTFLNSLDRTSPDKASWNLRYDCVLHRSNCLKLSVLLRGYARKWKPPIKTRGQW